MHLSQLAGPYNEFTVSQTNDGNTVKKFENWQFGIA
jgi:hypothetical protein